MLTLYSFSFALIAALVCWGNRQVYAEPCNVCTDGTPVPWRDKMIDMQILGDPRSVSCGSIADILPIVFPDSESPDCKLFRSMETLCGCPRKPNTCDLCPDGSEVVNEDVKLPQFGEIYDGGVFDCIRMQAYLHSVDTEDEFCLIVQAGASGVCGCPVVVGVENGNNNTTTTGAAASANSTNSTDVAGRFGSVGTIEIDVLWIPMFGSKTPEDYKVFASVARIACTLSFFGAILVIQDTVRSPNRRKQLYNQVVAIMASFDIVHSISVGLQQIPSSTEDMMTTPGEQGNAATCTAQAWFLQWGSMTSLFMNGALSTYFVLVIVYNSRGLVLKKRRKWIVGPPVVAGLGMAFAILPFASVSIQGCYITPPHPELVQFLNAHPTWIPYACLFFGPVFAVVFYVTFAQWLVYRHVRLVNTRSRRWSFNPTAALTRTPSSRRNVNARVLALEREVAWQAFMYLSALYLSLVTWSVALCNIKHMLFRYGGFWLFVSFVAPLQGFLNSLTYFRPRIGRMWLKLMERRKERRRRRREAAENNIPFVDPNQSSTRTSIPSQVRRDWAAVQSAEPINDLVELNDDIHQRSGDGSSGDSEESSSENTNKETQRNDTAAVAPPARDSSNSIKKSSALANSKSGISLKESRVSIEEKC